MRPPLQKSLTKGFYFPMSTAKQKQWTIPFTWYQYSQTLSRKIEQPKNAGFFTAEDAACRDMHFAYGSAGSAQDGNVAKLYWLVDKEDGIITDAKFQAFGQSALIGACELCCEVLIGKNYDQAQRMSTQVLDKEAQDRKDTLAFPDETASHLNLVIDAIEQTAQSCKDLPVASSYIAPPAQLPSSPLEGGYPDWDTFSKEQQVAIIEEVMDKEIRPYIEMDAGGVEVLDLVNSREVLIAYSGACTSCYSSVGATLNYIQQILQSKVHQDLAVVPDMENMSF